MAGPVKEVVIKLAAPVTFKDETYSEIRFGRCKAKHLMAMDAVKGDVAKSIALYAAMAEVPFQVVAEMDGDDYGRVAEETLPLMGKSVATAAKKAAKPG